MTSRGHEVTKGAETMTRASCTIVAVLMLSSGGVTSAQTPAASADTAADRQRIQAAANRIWSAVSKNDAASALAEYAEDAIVLAPGAAMLEGKPAIAKLIGDTFQAFSFRDVAGRTVDIQVSGNLAVETGTYAWTLVPRSGSPISDKGKYIHVWARGADGAWKVNRYIINSDMPTP
jgi:uncharacterized protein (TIGR02246 family)